MRSVVSRMSSAGGSGKPYNEPLYISIQNSDNPTVGTETPGAYLYKWDHDNSGDEWDYSMNQPFYLDWEASQADPFWKLAPYSTGAKMTWQFFPVSPSWASDLIASLSLTQVGTLGSYDAYPFAVGDVALCKMVCDGHTYEFDDLEDGRVCLWTADNDAYAAIYLEMRSTTNDGTLETKLAAANPSLWATHGAYAALQFG